MNTTPEIANTVLSQAGSQANVSPRLTPLGGLSELTASGSEAGMEGMGMGNAARMA